MKARPFKATPVPSTEGKGPDDTITKAQLVALVASRAKRDSFDDEATVRNRMRRIVTRDVELGRLEHGEHGVRLGDVASWASSRWPGRYDDLPKDERVGQAGLQIAPVVLSAVGHVLPMSIEGALREIVKMHDSIEALRSELESERAKVRELEPDATKWRAWIEKKARRRRPVRGKL